MTMGTEGAGIGHNSRINQTVLRSNPDAGYTKLANAFLQDSRLSYETKGLLAELLSRPDDWEIRAETLVKSGKAGRDKVWRMLREAEELGYAASRQARTERGKFQRLDYVVTDDPKLLIERAAREIATLISPLTEKTSAVIPFPEKTSAAVSIETIENQRNFPEHGKPVNGEPRTGKPGSGQPCTANPHHTKERYIQTTELTKGPLGKLAASIAAGFTVATPAAAAQSPIISPTEQVHEAPAQCWQNGKAQMAAGTNHHEAKAQREVWITPTGVLEVSGGFKAELLSAFPLVDLHCGLATAAANVRIERGAIAAMQVIRREFGYMQQREKAKEARYGKGAGGKPEETAESLSAKYDRFYDGVL